MIAIIILPILLVLFFGYQAMKKKRENAQRGERPPDPRQYRPDDFG